MWRIRIELTNTCATNKRLTILPYVTTIKWCSWLVQRSSQPLAPIASATRLHYLKRGSCPQKIALYWHARASLSVFKFLGFFLKVSRDWNGRPLPNLRLGSTYFGCTLEIGLPPEFIHIIGLLVNLLPTLQANLDGYGISVGLTFYITKQFSCLI